MNRTARGDDDRLTKGSKKRLRELYVLWHKPEKAALFEAVAEGETSKTTTNK